MTSDYDRGYDFGYSRYWRNRKAKDSYHDAQSADWQRGYADGRYAAWHEAHDGDEMLVAEHELMAMMGA